MTIPNLILCLLCLAAASPVLAEEPIAEPKSSTEVVVDEDAGVIHFVVDGETIVTIDKSGLTVEGDVRYSGTMHDIGASPENVSDQE